MKKLPLISMIIFMSIVLLGCATSMPVGSIYTDVKLPINATAGGGGPVKVGVAECSSILTFVATGDCSIETAKKNGGISKVHHVDWEANNILGIIGKYKVVVHGE